MTDRELMQQALDALQEYVGVVVSVNDPNDWTPKVADAGEPARKAIEALRARLAQPEPEQKCGAIIEVFGKDWRLDYMSLPVGKHKLYTQQYTYTAPPQREWQGLTKEEARELCVANVPYVVDMVAALEARLKEKNA